MTDKLEVLNYHLLNLYQHKRCILMQVRLQLRLIRSIGNPNIPDLSLIRQWLLDEGSIAKPELMKLIKDVTSVLSNLLIQKH